MKIQNNKVIDNSIYLYNGKETEFTPDHFDINLISKWVNNNPNGNYLKKGYTRADFLENISYMEIAMRTSRITIFHISLKSDCWNYVWKIDRQKMRATLHPWQPDNVILNDKKSLNGYYLNL